MGGVNGCSVDVRLCYQILDKWELSDVCPKHGEHVSGLVCEPATDLLLAYCEARYQCGCTQRSAQLFTGGVHNFSYVDSHEHDWDGAGGYDVCRRCGRKRLSDGTVEA